MRLLRAFRSGRARLRQISRQGRNVAEEDEAQLTLWMSFAADAIRSLVPTAECLASEIEQTKTQLVEGNCQFESARKFTSDAIEYATELIGLGETETTKAEVERKLYTSPFFYLPVVALVAAIYFAITGVIEINNLRVDVQEIAQRSIDRITSEIELYSADAKVKIDAERDRQLGLLTRKPAPELLADKINDLVEPLREPAKSSVDDRIAAVLDELSVDRVNRVVERTNEAEAMSNDLSNRLDTLESRMEPVEDGLKTLEAEAPALASPAWLLFAAPEWLIWVLLVGAVVGLLHGLLAATSRLR